MRSFLFVIMLLSGVLAFADGAYRWVDENGQVHYSDRPQEGAESVDLPAAQTFQTPQPAATAQRATRTTSATPDSGTFRYRSLSIVQPQPDQVFWNVAGKVPVVLGVDPRLQSGHTVRVYLDDQPVRNLAQTLTSFQLSDVYRGAHTVRAEISANGQVLQQSPTVTFHVRQTAIKTGPSNTSQN